MNQPQGHRVTSDATAASVPQPRRVDALDQRPQVMVRISSLLPSDSPRLDGESDDHVQLLTEADDLPPIIVHRATMRVIDGMHRLRAAMLLGRNKIAVEFEDGDNRDVFVSAVLRNNSHGLPLSLADRRAATTRLIGSHPDWSNRCIGSVVGLSATTVGTLRRHCPTAHSGQSNTTVGRDGRRRPIRNDKGRVRASELIRDKPTAPIRDIATAAGISPSTALDVRRRMREGIDPIPHKYGSGTTSHPSEPTGRSQDVTQRPSAGDGHYQAAIDDLRRDPSVRLTEAGRTLLRVLSNHMTISTQAEHIARSVPGYRTASVARLARLVAKDWDHLAELLEGTG